MKDRTEQVELTNMCVVEDEEQRAVAIDKVTGSYRGITFPGGHVEPGESFYQSVVREVREETGLNIVNPRLCGVYHWHRDGVHNILFIYHATEFSGSLHESREGRVWWEPISNLKKMKLATGSEHVITMIQSEQPKECVMEQHGDLWKGRLF